MNPAFGLKMLKQLIVSMLKEDDRLRLSEVSFLTFSLIFFYEIPTPPFCYYYYYYFLPFLPFSFSPPFYQEIQSKYAEKPDDWDWKLEVTEQV